MKHEMEHEMPTPQSDSHLTRRLGSAGVAQLIGHDSDSIDLIESPNALPFSHTKISIEMRTDFEIDLRRVAAAV